MLGVVKPHRRRPRLAWGAGAVGDPRCRSESADVERIPWRSLLIESFHAPKRAVSCFPTSERAQDQGRPDGSSFLPNVLDEREPVAVVPFNLAPRLRIALRKRRVAGGVVVDLRDDQSIETRQEPLVDRRPARDE